MAMNRFQSPSRIGLVALSMVFISFSILTYEIVLMRIFSVMLRYHYVFAIVSFVLFGIGFGGMFLQKWYGWFPKTSYHKNAAIFSMLIVGSVIGIIKLPIVKSNAAVDLVFWIYIMIAVFPFLFAGITVSEIFKKFSEHSSLLYGSDLLGASLGAFAVVPLLNNLDAVSAALVTALVASLGSLILSLSGNRFFLWGVASIVVVALGVLIIGGFNSKPDVPIAKDPEKDMYGLLKNPANRAEIVESRWSAFGRTDLIRSGSKPEEMYIYIDGAAGSIMYELKALLEDPSKSAQLIYRFGEFFPFFFLNDFEKENALIIGPGGGRDVVVAVLGGVKSITAVEVNPDIVQIVKDYEEFNGGIYTKLPNVRVVVDEGRNYLSTSKEKYDLIMLALPITKSTRSVEGYALTENYLFTVEAVKSYLDHLTPEGRIIIVAHNDYEIYRLIVLAIESLGKRGISQSEAMKHIYTIASGMMPTIVIKNQPFNQKEAEERHEMIHRLGYDHGNYFVPFVRQVTLRPDESLDIDKEWRMFDQILVDLSEGKLSLDQTIDAASMDISPVTDDRPFFYKYQLGLPKPFGGFSVLIVLVIGILILLVTIPNNSSNAKNQFVRALSANKEIKVFLLLFFFLGVGFMLIEISLFQKLMLFIGQPLFALTILLFSLLLGVGIGSLSSSWVRKNLKKAITVAAIFILSMTIIYTFIFGYIFKTGLNPKITSVLLLLPLGFVLGFPFPLSIRLMKIYGFESNIHVMWGFNGIASVIGSSLAMIIGILLGFSYAIYLGAILYGGVVLLSLSLPPFKNQKI